MLSYDGGGGGSLRLLLSLVGAGDGQGRGSVSRCGLQESGELRYLLNSA